MATLRKALQIAHRSRTSLGQSVNFAATPYEGQTTFIGAHNPANPTGYSWEGGTSAGNFLSGAPANYRPDLKLVAFKGSGGGFTFTHQSKSKSLNYNQFYGNRGIRTELYEFRDAGDSAWECYSGGHVASSIILPQGVTSRRGLNGENIVTIQSATPDPFLANLSLPQLPYILAGPANKERFSWWFLAQNGYLPPPAPLPNPLPTSETRKAATQNALGYVLQGQGQGGIADGHYVDPFAGFANYRDQYALTVGELMTPAPANDLHFFNALDVSRVLVELFTNHVLANGKGIGQTFGLEIATGQALENDLLHFEVSGGINSIISEAAQHGVWRWWWDSKSQFHFVNDYYGGGGGGKVAATIVDGPSLIGDIEVMLGTPEARVNRVAVRGQPFTSFGDATTDPMSNYYNMKLGAVYPPGAGLGSYGTDITMDNYMGKNASAQAYRLWHKENAQTTFSWKNFPYPTLAMGLLNREIRVKAKDPKGAWDFTANDGKRFVVTDVEGQLQDGDSPTGGYFLCSISGIEI